MPYLPLVVTINGNTPSTVLTEEERTILTSRLKAAEEAEHLARLGQQARVFVDQNGERVEFNLIKATDLRAYILDLKVKLGLPTGISGPMRPWVL